MLKLAIVFCAATVVSCGTLSYVQPSRKIPICYQSTTSLLTCQAKSMMTKRLGKVMNTRVGWGDVTPKGFIARWEVVPNAHCYRVEILFGYTVHHVCFIPCYKSTVIEYKGPKVKPFSIYGIRVSAVDIDGKCAEPGTPARTRTLWAPTTAPKTKPAPTYTPEPKQCGKRFFTCHSNKTECIPNRKWCDRQLHCRDGSDERGCPGGCEELDLDFKNGNYSCSRWGSPGSACFFDCNKNYKRDGKWYTRCSKQKKKWTNPIPTCRLSFTKSLRVVSSTNVSITVAWEPVPGAFGYTFLAIQRLEEGDERVPMKKALSFGVENCCEAELTNLIPDAEFKITVRATDDNDIDGLESLAAYGRTVTSFDTYDEEIDDEEENDEKE